MGGVSDSNITIGSDYLSWEGEVEIVPSLSAPGFCLVETVGRHIFPDASAYTHLTLKASLHVKSLWCPLI